MFTINKDWWKTLFNQNYNQTYFDILTPEITDQQIRFLLKNILKNKKTALDLACGFGRHAIKLAQKMVHVTGLDYSDYQIKIAKQTARELEILNVDFVRKDMRHFTFSKKFDAVINLFSSFGYFKNESDHAAVLKNVANVLTNQGLFFMDIRNGSVAINTICRLGKLDKKNGLLTMKRKDVLSNKIHIVTQDWFEPLTMRWITKRTWTENKRQKHYISSVRLFSLPEITALLSLHGFIIQKVWGSYTDDNFNPKTSGRLLILSKKASQRF